MGKKTKLREAQREHAAEVISARLATHSRTSVYPALVARYGDFKPHYQAQLEPYLSRTERAPEKWRCRSKSRCEDQRFMDLVRFTFARYPVAEHLARVWVDGFDDDFIDRVVPVPGAASHDRPDLREWFIIAGQGGSLYERASHPYLSRIETHHFLTAPPALTSARRAFWYAFARAETADAQRALDVAQTRLVDFSVASSFWKSAARFFARNATTVVEMNDLIDYILAARQADAAFVLKGRSLAGLRRRMEAWHRELRAKHAGCLGEWAGSPLPDSAYEIGKEPAKTIWRFRQLKTGVGLLLEGERMQHCVARYQIACVCGDTSIWSLTAESPPGRRTHSVTIELRRDGVVKQCRGLANRLPAAIETAMIERWAKQHGLAI